MSAGRKLGWFGLPDWSWMVTASFGWLGAPVFVVVRLKIDVSASGCIGEAAIKANGMMGEKDHSDSLKLLITVA
jgi:hypothetical protein